MEKVLADAELVTSVLAGAGGLINPAVGAGAALLDRLLRLAKASVAAHEAISGQPIDLALLHHIDPV